MIKNTNKRIAITLSKREVDMLDKLAEYTGFSKSVLIKQAISDFIYEQYKGREKQIE